MIAHKLKRKTNPPAWQSAVAHQTAPSELRIIRQITNNKWIDFFPSCKSFPNEIGFCFCLVSMTTATTSVETQFIWLPGKSFRVGETANDKSYFIIFIHVHTYCKDSIPDLYRLGSCHEQFCPIFHPAFQCYYFPALCACLEQKNQRTAHLHTPLCVCGYGWTSSMCFYTLTSQYASNKFTLAGTILCPLYLELAEVMFYNLNWQLRARQSFLFEIAPATA